MKRIIFLLLILLVSCQTKNTHHPKPAKTEIADNPELHKMFKNGIEERRKNQLDFSEINEKDSLRRQRVHQMLDTNTVRTSKDYYRAAVIFLYSDEANDSKLAVHLIKKAIALDPKTNKWVLAAATDRYLLSKGEPQIYGTQYRRNKDGTLKLAEMDPAKISDKKRQEYGVRTLAQQQARLKKWNSKSLYDLVKKGRSIEEVLHYIQNTAKETSPYDLSESGINKFGYNVMGRGKPKKALKIFKLNTELYPKGWNAFDSLGECLWNLGKNDEAIAAYKKSLELNPDNDVAEFSISEIKNGYKKRLPKKDTFYLL